MDERLVRFPEVKAATAQSRSTIYLRIHAGLFPRPIQLGPRMVAWREREIEAINAARIRGATDVEIKALVANLEAQRKKAA